MNDVTPGFLQATIACVKRLKAAVLDHVVKVDGGGVNPLEILQHIKVTGVELAVLREFLFDHLATNEIGEIDRVDRYEVAEDYYEKFQDALDEKAKELEAPRILQPGLNGARLP